MTHSEILVYFSLKYKGDWDKIYRAIVDKEEVDEKYYQNAIKKVKSKIVTLFDDDYPQSILPISKPPFVLYYYGDISLIKDRYKCISVVGSRKVSEYGAESTTYLVSDLCKEFIIVSGMADGVDGLAHRAAINNGGKTVGVLGSGIDFCFPPENEDIYKIIKEKHLLLSEYPNSTYPTKLTFPIRNRIVAGLSQGLLITEGKIASGTSITANLVAERGDPVCCVPAPIGQDSLCNHLIANGAALVENANDVYLEFGYQPHHPIFEEQKNLKE